MNNFELVITCSLKAYELIIDAINNSPWKMTDKKFKDFDKGYLYFEFDNENIDAFTIEEINYIYDQVHKINEMGEQAAIRQINY
ncbi:hypothetical protein [Acinetobacter dispersus]|uniref:hypothetical protein n=1 Tax=Acinetobacter dispersus TaxID=70348 RepID=UPI0021CD9140|nr:hypothetical protein [Acinetobacter dispersus]MCU4336046.1 hypothetical protein [Acinetobacter dispersus]